MSNEGQINAELSVLIEEYKALKTEINSNLGSARLVGNLTVTALGILIASSKYLIDAHLIIIFLGSSMLFCVFAWTQLRYTFLVLDLGAYLRGGLAPRIREALEELAPESTRDFSHVLKWEDAGKGLTRRYAGIRRLTFLPIASGGYGIPVLAGALCTLMYSLLVLGSDAPRYEIGPLETGIAGLNLAALFHSAIWGWVAERER